MHRAAYAALGLDFAYIPFGIQGDLEGALRGMRALGIRGFGISMPYKQQVLSFLDRLDGLAQRVGAVNTVVNEEGTLVGYNTDAAGAVAALEECRTLAGARILLVGAGGAARAVAHGVLEAGARVLHIANRSPERAGSLASELLASYGSGARVESSGLDALGGVASFDILINASSAGMTGYGEFPWQPAECAAGLLVMDVVYRPLESALVRRCRAVGQPVIGGGRMLLHQAARQFELYTGCSAPLTDMASALEMALAHRS